MSFIKNSFKLQTDQLFGIDRRSLALFRISLALVVFSDLIHRFSSLRAHYSDGGVLPRIGLLQEASGAWRFSLHMLNGTPEIQALLFLIAAIFALALLFGYRTRLANFVLWILTISLFSRNPLVLQGGDTLLGVLLFWGLFLPLGAAYSVDRALSKPTPEVPQRILSVGSAALLLQVCFVYWFTVILKWSPIWWSEGSAIYYALSIDHFTTPLGKLLLEFPRLMQVLTYYTLWLELLGPLLAFSPFFTGQIRTLIVGLFITLHMGMGLCLELGHFPFVSMTSWLVFLPSWFWDKIFARLKAWRAHSIKIYYDAQCAFCEKIVLILHTFFLWPETPLRPAQSEAPILAMLKKENSWVLTKDGKKFFFQWQAVIEFCRASPLLWIFTPLLGWRPIRWIGEKIYRLIANFRPALSFLTKPLKFRALKTRYSPITQVLAAFFLIYIFLWNLRSTEIPIYEKAIPKPAKKIGQFLRIAQGWAMFAPYPLKNDGWFVIPAKLKNGAEVDLFQNGKPVSWEKPELVSALYPNQRWRKYMMNLWRKKDAGLTTLYAKYLCRQWNRTHPDEQHIESLQITYMLERTLPGGQSHGPIKRTFFKYTCDDKKASQKNKEKNNKSKSSSLNKKNKNRNK